MSGLQPYVFVGVLTQGYALGWDMAAPLALRVGGCWELGRCVGQCMGFFVVPSASSGFG